ncbi:Flp family type IVb pilin [Dongshaea marina]|uniref:Flp family type IVb pilin n=1 Tax=Dongshaea marina TaxID=2047966 RepID=UPI000D3E2388|nr:Flp family type IVb pilin [Dongshaea marina]
MFNDLCRLGYTKVKILSNEFFNDERGVTAVEYAIVGVAISAIVAAVMGEGGVLNKALNHAVDTISANIDKAADAGSGSENGGGGTG